MRKSLFFFMFFLMVSNVHGETIHLKSGKDISGKIIERADDHIKLDVEGVALTYYFDSINNIEDVKNIPAPVVTEPPHKEEIPVSVPVSRPIPQSEKDIKYQDYIKADYSPGIDLSTDQIVIDPTHALNALGLKIDENHALATQMMPAEANQLNSIGLKLALAVLFMIVFAWIRSKFF